MAVQIKCEQFGPKMTNFSPISVPVKRLIFVAYLFQGTIETVVEGNNSGVCLAIK